MPHTVYVYQVGYHLASPLAKGDTVKITIEMTLQEPIEITDSAVRQFNIWSGFIIDSNKRLEEIPQGVRHYKVSFYEGCDAEESSACHTAEPSLAYLVTYAYDASAEGDGFVYLPGGHDEFAIQAEIIALRHQLTVLKRTQKPRRLALTRGDRCLWVWLSPVAARHPPCR